MRNPDVMNEWMAGGLEWVVDKGKNGGSSSGWGEADDDDGVVGGCLPSIGR